MSLSKLYTSVVAILLALFVFSVEARIPGNRRIVGGQPAEAGRYPYQVGLLSSLNGTPFCGGTLITPNVILSAAHCPKPAYALIGCLDVRDSACEKTAVTTAIKHPSYSSSTTNNDYQLFVMAADSKFSPVPYVADESYAAIPDGQDVTVSGWGTTSSGGSVSRYLLEVEVDVVSQSACKSAYGQSAITDAMICASRSGKDSCQGDSGGPLTIRCDATLGDIHVGVVSWGRGCALAAYPGVYSRTSFGYSWIVDQLEGLGQGDALATPPPLSNPCSGEKVPTKAPVPTVAPAPTPAPTCGFFFC